MHKQVYEKLLTLNFPYPFRASYVYDEQNCPFKWSTRLRIHPSTVITRADKEHVVTYLGREESLFSYLGDEGRKRYKEVNTVTLFRMDGRTPFIDVLGEDGDELPRSETSSEEEVYELVVCDDTFITTKMR
jgi:hypothetical protein